MRLIKTEDAVGSVLCHDITQIIKGVTKDAVFRKGHIVAEEDIPVLLSVGKEQLYIWDNDETMLHENEAAEILCSICLNDNMKRSRVKEGKIELTAECSGLFKIRRDKLKAINSLGQMMIASRHGDTAVRAGDKLLGTRIIPLVISMDSMDKAKEAAGGDPIFSLLPFTLKKAGIVTTGNEVYRGRIADTFTPVIIQKLKDYNAEVTGHITLPDEPERITKAIIELIENGAELVCCTGGMSVDPHDQTPLAIKNTGAHIVSYGAPVLPGAMFLLAYCEYGGRTVPIVGLPGCVMYAERTIFDLILPRLMAEDPVTPEDLASLGEGGLCLSCPVCTFPNCGFGKGV